VGQTAITNDAPLFLIIRDGDIELEAEIIDRDLPFLAIGQRAEATIAGFEDVVSGKIRLIDPVIDEKMRIAKVRVSLDRVPGPRVGLFAQVKIETDIRRSVVIPQSALQTSSRHGHSVKIVENGIVRTRQVVTGLSDKDGTEIVAGVSGGELVVSRAAGFLRDGDRVNPLIASKTTAGGVTRLE
jgi:HlyD family secretion protein